MKTGARRASTRENDPGQAGKDQGQGGLGRADLRGGPCQDQAAQGGPEQPAGHGRPQAQLVAPGQHQKLAQDDHLGQSRAQPQKGRGH